MAVRTERAVSALNSNFKRVGRAQDPKLAQVKEVLLTLRTRLETQIDTGVEDGSPEARAVLRTVRRRLNQVETALERIEVGKYGLCTDCSKPIEADRMTLQPFSTRCTGCQTVAEWKGLIY